MTTGVPSLLYTVCIRIYIIRCSLYCVHLLNRIAHLECKTSRCFSYNKDLILVQLHRKCITVHGAMHWCKSYRESHSKWNHIILSSWEWKIWSKATNNFFFHSKIKYFFIIRLNQLYRSFEQILCCWCTIFFDPFGTWIKKI